MSEIELIKKVNCFNENCKNMQKNWQEYIGLHPEIRFGKPCIIGTRISVYDVLSWLSQEMTIEEILADYPVLSREHILACLSYAADKERKLRCA